MIEEKHFELNDIKEIRLNWDFENVIFPRSVIKKFSYSYNKDKINYFQDRLYLSEFYLEVYLDYVINEFSYFDIEKREDKKNIDCLKYNNVWYITITTNDDREYELELPFYSKKFYLDKNTNIYNDRNLFEQHEQKEDSYIIKWKEDKEITKLSLEEMILLFQNKKKKGTPITKNNFQIEVLSRLLKEKSENERIDLLSIFYNLLRGELYSIKEGYDIATLYKDEKDFSLVSLNIFNDLKNGNIHYLFIRNINNYQNIFNLLKSLNKNDDFNKIIIVLNDSINKDDFYQKLSGYSETINNIIYLSLNKMNQIWFELIHNQGI